MAKVLVSGLVVIAPIYLVILLLAKAMSSLVGLVRPLAKLLPDWVPADQILSFLLVLLACFLVGLALRTSLGEKSWEWIEKSLFLRLPGYASIRGLARQIAGGGEERAWHPALAEIEEALVPAFIIEELEDGRFTVFVPSVPTPLAGAIYVLTPDRVHPVNVPFAQAIKVVSQWGSGAKALVAAMEEHPKVHEWHPL